MIRFNQINNCITEEQLKLMFPREQAEDEYYIMPRSVDMTIAMLDHCISMLEQILKRRDWRDTKKAETARVYAGKAREEFVRLKEYFSDSPKIKVGDK